MIENNTGFCETCSDGYYTTPSRYDSEWDCHLRACEVAGTGGGSGPAGPLGPSGSPKPPSFVGKGDAHQRLRSLLIVILQAQLM